MARFALDFSYARPTDLAGAEGVLVYSGGARPDDAYLELLGVSVVWIFESDPTRAFAGYDAGRADCRFHESRVPAGVLSYVVAADTPRIGANGPGVSDYFRGWADTTREAVFGAYGGRDALDAARAGSPKVARFWGVETWGQPNWDGYDLDLMQIANTPSPVEGTDYNVIITDVWDRIGPSIPDPKEPALYWHATNAATDTTIGIDAGSYWLESSTRFIKRGQPPAGVIVEDIDGDALAILRQEKIDILAGARAALSIASETGATPTDLGPLRSAVEGLAVAVDGVKAAIPPA